MSTFDVRTAAIEPITALVFADADHSVSVAYKIKPYHGSIQGIDIVDEFGEHVVVKRGDVDGLIRALQKAKELGWV